MVDPKIEEKIKKTNEFMELWMKFRELYTKAVRKETIRPEEETAFLETKSLIARKYQALLDRLGMEPSMDDKTFDVVSQVLSLQGVSSLSDVSIQEIENGWHRSFIFLNKLLGTLENQKEALSHVTPLAVWAPKMKVFLKEKRVRIALLVVASLVVANVIHLGEKLIGILTALGWWEWIQGFLPTGTS